jgi:predicted nucleic acid-binding protein
MFDTVVFNRIVDGRLNVTGFAGKAKFCVTHIQRDELNATSDAERRQLLQQAFQEVAAESIPTESLILDVSRLGEAKLGVEDGLYDKIKVALDARKYKPNNIQDALIAETAIINGCMLVTDDGDLAEIVRNHHGRAINVTKFQDMMTPGNSAT